MFGPITYRLARPSGCFVASFFMLFPLLGCGAVVAGRVAPAIAIFATLITVGVIGAANRDNIDMLRIKIDDEGIAAAEWQWLKLAWRDVRDVQVIHVGREGTVLALEVDNEEHYRQQLSRSMRAMMQVNDFWRGSFFSFSVERLDAPKAEVIAEVRRRAGLDPGGRPSFRF